MTKELGEKTEFAVLGGGCFWCLEAAFLNIEGVQDAISGYAGGDQEDPTYEEVSRGNTGHAETVKVIFDKEKISYRTILSIFFQIHNPTTPDRQGNDIGSQYRSIILYASDKQKKTAQDMIKKMTAQKIYADPIVTQVAPLEVFYPAESRHQRYFEKNPFQAYCQLVIAPKLSKLKRLRKDLHQ
jgi:peptide-methionine (S)-S-oxide reductase